MRVLFVEDHAGLRTVMARLLERAGHVVCAAASMAGAFRCLETEPIDIAFVDLILVGERGEELADAIRVSWPRVRVIAVTGSLANIDGFDRVVLKPYSIGDLLEAMRGP